MSRKKVAIFIPELVVGGAENMVAQLTTHLNSEKFEVMLIVIGVKQKTPIQEYLNTYNMNVVYLGKGLGMDYNIIYKVYKLLNRFKPDIIHTHLFSFAYAFPWVLCHKVKMLHTVHNMPKFELTKKGKMLISILYKLNKAVPVAISSIIEKQMIEMYKVKNIETIYNPVNTKRYFVERQYNKKHVITFINVGRMVPQKNQELLIQSFALVLKALPEAKLKIAGDGYLKENLIKLVIENGIKDSVEFLGNVKEVEKEFAKADIFVLSSDYEGLPLTVLEAMASGLPIISTDVGGVSDVVTDNGILVEPNNIQQLSEEMIRLGSNFKECEKMGNKSLENIKDFDINNITLQYEEIYLKYLK